MRIIVFILVISLLPVIGFCSDIYDGTSFIVNNTSFTLSPQVNYRTSTSMMESLTFSSIVSDYPDSCLATFTNPALDMVVSFHKTDKYLVPSWVVRIACDYKQDILIRDLALKLDFAPFTNPQYLTGWKAINNQLQADNRNLYPYTDKIEEIDFSLSKVWIAGANYQDTNGVEWINNNIIYLYDEALHFARRFNQTDQFLRIIDYMPRHSGDKNLSSLLIFEQKPEFVNFNLWPGNKKAAFALTNDADGETVKKLQSAYLGSSNPANPGYMTKGLIANHIKVSNTVFARNLNALRSTWQDIKDHGNAIGLHTYAEYSDSTAIINRALQVDMADFDVRMWIDHSLPQNLEDFGMNGGDVNSPFYIQDAINRSGVDYAWLGDTPSSNEFNAFNAPWRLPHRLYYFQNMTRPVWFYGRTRMETWEYLDSFSIYDLKHNLTAANLDNLLLENGLCVGYTHLSFPPLANCLTFYDLMDGDEYNIRNDFNDVLIMLDEYQNQRGLWVDTAESIFDRMLAMEQVVITKIESDICPGFLKVTIANNSDIDIPDIYCSLGLSSDTITLLAAHSNTSLLLNTSHPVNQEPEVFPYLLIYSSNNVFIRSKNGDVVPPMNVKIFNAKGQLVYSVKTKAEQNYVAIPFKSFSSGVYILQSTSTGYKPLIQKINVFK